MKMKKLAAAVGMALSLGIVSQASAEIKAECCGARGDALMFPVFIGAPGYENYYAITNDANAWIQGHVRFRGAAWCGELIDFDVILSPGDVFVFRVADVDGDGRWEIDQSLDELNFQYTGLLETPDMGDTGLSTSHCTHADDGSTQWKCMQPSFELIPDETDIFLTEGRITYQQQVGYIQFFGEAILTDMTHEIMAVLMSGVPGNWDNYQTDVFSKRGTNAWKWSNAAGQFARFAPVPADSPWVGDRGLSDVPNMLAGVGFISTTGKTGVGVAFNAMALTDFRTGETNHRIDNYRVDTDGFHMDIPRDADGTPTSAPVAGQVGLLEPTSAPETVYRNGQPVTIVHAGTSREDRAVIVHNENGAASATGISPEGDYIYGYGEVLSNGTTSWESGVAFNNTWGPTLADGDDYNVSNVCTVGTTDIDFHDALVSNTRTSSVVEVEEAIRNGRQHFGGYYFDGAAPGPNHQGYTSLRSWFFAFFPTKFFYSEDQSLASLGVSFEEAIITQARNVVAVTPAKTYIPQVWDIEERTSGPVAPTVTIGQCISPAIGPECFTTTTGINFDPEMPLSECLTVFNIGQIKEAFSSNVGSFTTGRFMLSPKDGYNNPDQECNLPINLYKSYPAMMFGFEWGAENSLAHWRCLIH
jgi:hypothetical protein